METLRPGLPGFPGLLRPSSGRGHLPTPKAEPGFSSFRVVSVPQNTADSNSSNRSRSRSTVAAGAIPATGRKRHKKKAAAAALKMRTGGGGSNGRTAVVSKPRTGITKDWAWD